MLLSLGRYLSPVNKSAADKSLKGVIASCVFDLDATKSASYSGTGQIWKNIVPVPADGAAQSAYDFTFGLTDSISTDDAAFTGSAGSASAYFSLDGGDVFRIPAMTTFLKNLQKTTGGSDWWWAMAFRYASNGNAQTFLSTRLSASTVGISLQISAANQVQLGMRGDTANATTSSSALTALSTNTDYLLIGSFSAGQSFRWWLNSSTKTAISFVPNTCTTDASGLSTIGGSAATSPGTQMGSGTRIYAVSMGNAYIDNAEAAKIIAAYNARHGRSYA